MSAVSDPSLCLVTGGAGFIGSHLTAALLAEGMRVRVLDNLSSGNPANLAPVEARIDFRQGDIRSADDVRHAMQGVRYVFHLAALVSVVESIQKPALAEAINVIGTANVFAAAVQAGVERTVFSSSCALYGNTTVSPQHEALPPDPTSPYAAHKLAGERLAHELNQAADRVVCLRYFNVYGPRQNPRSDYAAVIPKFLALALQKTAPTIYGDGEQTRDFVYVGDIVRANLRAATATFAHPGSRLFNIGSGAATSVNELWGMINRLTGQSVAPLHQPARSGEVRHSRASTRQTNEVLDFHPLTALPDGLARTAASLGFTPSPVE